MNLRLVGLVTVILLPALSLQAGAEVAPVGPEFQVNKYTTGSQRDASVAADASGNFVVVWDSGSYYAASQDGSRSGVFGQRYSAAGTPVGTEFQVNTYTTGFQDSPAIASGPGGDFVVAWQSGSYYDGSGQDGSAYGAFIQRFASSGAPLGTEFQANTYTRGSQANPAIASDPSGNFVVVWQSSNYSGPDQDGDGSGVFGQRFDAGGLPLGTEFQANTFTTDDQTSPSVTSDAAGNFVVAWSSGRYYGPSQDGDARGVFARRFASSGAPLGTEFQVNTYTTGDQSDPSIATDAAGNFVVVWSSSGYYTAQDGSSSGIFAQRFDASGLPDGTEFQVNTYTASAQGNPSVASTPSGEFVVAWTSRGSYYTGPDGSGSGVFAQHFASSGAPLGTEFQVNTYTTRDQLLPAVATDPAGRFVIAWQSSYYGNQDGDDAGVFAQRFRTTATAPPNPVLGKKLALSDDPADSTRKRLSVASTDPAIDLGGGNGSADDPTLTGGSLRVRSAAFDNTYDLPASRWRTVGLAGQNRGYVYDDRGQVAGAIQRALIKNGRLKAAGRGSLLAHDLDVNPDPVVIVFQIGTAGKRYCIKLGGTSRFKPQHAYRAKNGPTLSVCPN
jgi:hypothetical protein